MQNESERHETPPSVLAGRAAAGFGCTVHAVPFHVSTIALEAGSAWSSNSVAFAAESPRCARPRRRTPRTHTRRNTAPGSRPPTRGAGTWVQEEPFQLSASEPMATASPLTAGCPSSVKPTAMQACADTHDTLRNRLSVGPTGTGVGTIVQLTSAECAGTAIAPAAANVAAATSRDTRRGCRRISRGALSPAARLQRC